MFEVLQKKGGRTFSVDFAKNFDLFVKTNSRGAYLKDKIKKRCNIKLSEVYDYTYQKEYERVNEGFFFTREKTYNFLDICYGSYMFFMRTKRFIMSYYKWDRVRKLGRNKLNVVRSRKTFIKRWRLFRMRASRYFRKKG